MIRKKYGIHFQSHGNRPALTLKHEYVSNDKNAIGMQSRTHKSGWTIFGKIKSCYFTWVNKFYEKLNENYFFNIKHSF